MLSLLLDAAPVADKIPTAVYFTLGVTILASIISAGVSFYASIRSTNTAKEVARLSASYAQEIKDKEFANEFYKKVIDKRLKSIETIEKILEPFASDYQVIMDDSVEDMHSFFAENIEKIDDEEFVIFRDNAYVSNLWLSKRTANTFSDFTIAVLEVVKEVRKTSTKIEKAKICIKHYNAIDKARIDTEKSIGVDMTNLHDVKSFLDDRFSIK